MVDRQGRLDRQTAADLHPLDPARQVMHGAPRKSTATKARPRSHAHSRAAATTKS